MKFKKLILIISLIGVINLTGCSSNETQISLHGLDSEFAPTCKDKYVYHKTSHIVYILSDGIMVPYIGEDGEFVKYDLNNSEFISLKSEGDISE